MHVPSSSVAQVVLKVESFQLAGSHAEKLISVVKAKPNKSCPSQVVGRGWDYIVFGWITWLDLL